MKKTSDISTVKCNVSAVCSLQDESKSIKSICITSVAAVDIKTKRIYFQIDENSNMVPVRL